MKELFISNIQRFSVGDGPGIRTTVFMKGCNLHCPWCHNPETISAKAEVLFTSSRCTGCGRCITACPNHTVISGAHHIDRGVCSACGKCVQLCPSGALELSGRSISVDQIVKEVLEDKEFYQASDGGVTLSGGEPLLQADGCAALAQTLQQQNVSVLLDTAGCVPFSAFEKVLPYLSMCYFDLKSVNEQGYRIIGGNLSLVLDNLKKMVASGVPTVVRIPVIPHFNAHQLADFATVLQDIGPTRVDLLPFHRMGSGKYAALGSDYAYANTPSLSPEELLGYQTLLMQHGLTVTIGG